MQALSEGQVSCPYCGEAINVLLDPSETGQSYIEDCQVCCCPIVFTLQPGPGGEPVADVRREDD